MWLQSNTVNFPCLVWKRLFTKKNTRSKDWKTLTQDTGKRHLNCQVTSSDINRSRIHLRGGKRKKNAKPARFPCGALNARKFTVVSREPASFLSFSYFFLFLQLFLFASSSSPFLHLVPFLFSFFFFYEKEKKGSRFVRVDLLLHGWEGRTNLSRDEISLENEVDGHVNRFSSILFYVCSILTRNQRQDLRPLSRLLLRLIHIGAPTFTSSSFSIKKARENLYIYGNYNYQFRYLWLIEIV